MLNLRVCCHVNNVHLQVTWINVSSNRTSFTSVHAAVIAINEAIDHQDAEATLNSLKNPAAYLLCLDGDNIQAYQDVLYAAKKEKVQNALNRVRATNVSTKRMKCSRNGNKEAWK